MNQQQSIDLDVELMSSSVGYSLEMLMEVAGQGVAASILDYLSGNRSREKTSILLIIGPGNNGGDGLVAARYLKLYASGFLGAEDFDTNQLEDVEIKVFLVQEEKVKKKFPSLLLLLEAFEIQVLSHTGFLEEREWDVVVDCVFGFSFRPPLREPYVEVVKWMASRSAASTKLISVDIPSGWTVDKGPSKPEDGTEKTTLYPAVIISLTAPKFCVSARSFEGAHYCTGRFIPPKLAKKFNLDIPKYPPGSLFVRLQ